MSYYRRLLVNIMFTGFWLVRSQYIHCQDDILYEPEEGIMEELGYTWLGILQYLHVKSGNPYYFRAPRVVLVSPQYVLSTARDAAQIPDGFVIGNVIFGEYERDEAECGVSVTDFQAGAQCEPAIVMIPVTDVLLHPEYKHFGASYSVALLKLISAIKSEYMIPVCLPFKNYLSKKRDPNRKLWHVDFATAVPRNFLDEEKELSALHMLPRQNCFPQDGSQNFSASKKTIFCSTECDFHSGAPTIIHELTGHWTLVSIAEDSVSCPDPLRRSRSPLAPRHIAIYPYSSWITTAVTGKSIKNIKNNDPFGFKLAHSPDTRRSLRGWYGHWWLGGIPCLYREHNAKGLFRFYHELFIIHPKPGYGPNVNYVLQIYAPLKVDIECVKVFMPFRISQPQLWRVGTPEVTVRIPIRRLNHSYYFHVEAWGSDGLKQNEVDSSEDDSKLVRRKMLKQQSKLP